MHDALAVRVVQRVGDARNHADNLRDGQRGPLLDQGRERAAIDELHHDVGRPHVVDLHDIGVTQAAGGLGLVPEALPILFEFRGGE